MPLAVEAAKVLINALIGQVDLHLETVGLREPGGSITYYGNARSLCPFQFFRWRQLSLRDLFPNWVQPNRPTLSHLQMPNAPRLSRHRGVAQFGCSSETL